MDGVTRQVRNSLQFRLSAWLAGVILAVALIAGAVSFVLAFQDANELQDDQLRQVAALVNQHPLPVTPSSAPQSAVDTDSEARVILQILPEPGSQAPKAGPGQLALPADLADGIQTVMAGRQAWRLFVKTLNSGPRIVVGQQTAVRDEIARNNALRTLMPFVILIPILLLLVGSLIRQMLLPLKQLASELDQRLEQDLREVSETRVPSEIRPFVVAINRLLSRVAQAMAVQRRFVADAAHELRSPLTALSLQTERLESAEMSAPARERLVTLRGGLQRTRLLLDQLLALARAQQGISTEVPAISVQRVFRQVLEDLMPLAQVKHIDLGVPVNSDAALGVAVVDLTTLIRNLVENAIRYTPAGGRVDLSVQTAGNSVIVQVDDTGPGIPEGERERVFDAFYRSLGNDEVGSGLGLSIVKAIADRVGAEISLDDSALKGETRGLRVSVRFPAASG
ncbi:MAG: ATP-binding protein [Polaromonas sp.]